MEISRRKFMISAATASVVGVGFLVWRSGELAAVEVVLPTEPERLPVDCDTVIANGLIVDGTGALPYLGAIALKGNEIVAIGDFNTLESVKVYDANGDVIAPGFIDIHTHTENYLHSGGNPKMILTQGVTTQVGGNCGTSPSSIAEFWATTKPLGVNLGVLMGYKSLRRRLLGKHSEAQLNYGQITKMIELLKQDLDAGALGLSVGLEYFPQYAATVNELRQLSVVLKEKNRFLAAHIRNEFNRVDTAFEELVEIGKATGVQIQYSHTKALLKENWDKHPKVLERLAQVRSEGLNITSDVYNYTFSGWDVDYKPVRRSMSTENIYMAMKHDGVFFASDSGLKSGGKAIHPRAYGNFPRLIRSSLDQQLMPLEQVIYKMTGFPASRLNIVDRGTLKVGNKADIVVFNQDRITDKATAENPMILSEGVMAVWLNGEQVVEQGVFLDKYVGQPIKAV